jgi:hypothetical protein
MTLNLLKSGVKKREKACDSTSRQLLGRRRDRWKSALVDGVGKMGTDPQRLKQAASARSH